MQIRKLGIWLLSLLLVGMSVSVGSFAENTDQVFWSGQVFKNGENTVFNLPVSHDVLYDLEKKKVVTLNEFFQADFEEYRVYLEKGNLTFEDKKTKDKKVVDKGVTHDRFFVSQKYVFRVTTDHQKIAIFNQTGNQITEIELTMPCKFIAEGGVLYAYRVNSDSTVSIGYVDPEKKEFKFLKTTKGYGISATQGGIFIWNEEQKAKGFFNTGKFFEYTMPEYTRYTMVGENIYYTKNETDIYMIGPNQSSGKLVLKCKEGIENIQYFQGKLILLTNDWQYREMDLKEKVIKKSSINSVYGTIDFNDKVALITKSKKSSLIEREPSGKLKTVIEDVVTSVVKDGIAYYIDNHENLHAIEIATKKKLWTLDRRQLANGKKSDDSSLNDEYGLALVGNKLFGFQQYGTFIVSQDGKLINTGEKAYLQYRSADGYATYFNDNGYGIWNLKTNKITNIDLRKPFEMTRNGYTVKVKLKKGNEETAQIDIFKGSKKLLSGVSKIGDDILWIGEDALLFMEENGKTKGFSYRTGKSISQLDLNTHSVDEMVWDQIVTMGHQDNNPEVLMGYQPKTGDLIPLHNEQLTDYFGFMCENGLLIDRRVSINSEGDYDEVFNRYAFYDLSNTQLVAFNLLGGSYDRVQFINGIIYMLDNGGVGYTLDANTMEEMYLCQ